MKPDSLGAARRYVRRGWSPVPIPLGEKGSARKGWQNLRLTEADLPRYFNGNQNVGLLLGKPSGGLTDVDLDAPEALRLAPGFLPPTASVFGRPSKPQSHWLYVANPLPATAQFRDTDRRMLVELRSTGCQTIFPPSIHPTGEVITFDQDADPATVAGHGLRAQVARLAAATLVVRHWPEPGSRQDCALALSGGLLRGGWSTKDVNGFVWAVAFAAGDEETTKRASAAEYTARRLEQLGPTTGWPRLAELVGKGEVDRVRGWLAIPEAGSVTVEVAGGYHLTDLGNARRLVGRHGHDLRYVPQWRKWLVWDGSRWAKDDTGEVVRRAKDAVAHIYTEAAQAPDEDRRTALARHAVKSEAEARIRAMIVLATSEPHIPVTPDQLDAHQWVLNCTNGTLDLHTGELRSHRREELITKLAPVEYDPRATCPTWTAFLNRIMAGNPGLIAFLQRAVGYALTGDVSEQVLFFLYGTGANGKTTFLTTLLRMLGEYAKQAEPELLLAKRGETHPTGVADLAGSRLVVSMEVERGRPVAEVLVKQLAGGDRVKARFMRQDFFEFEPTHKVFLAANHKPVIRGTDYAIWRRIRLIPFTITIPERERDRQLLEKLQGALPGILAWAVRGCLEWQRDGLDTPPEVLAATRAYREEMDVLADFLGECCVQGVRATATAEELYRAYLNWCERNGERPLTQREFGMGLTERGFTRRKTHGRSAWQGIGLVAQFEAGGDDGDQDPASPYKTHNT